MHVENGFLSNCIQINLMREKWSVREKWVGDDDETKVWKVEKEEKWGIKTIFSLYGILLVQFPECQWHTHTHTCTNTQKLVVLYPLFISLSLWVWVVSKRNAAPSKYKNKKRMRKNIPNFYLFRSYYIKIIIICARCI